jgi:hypothetical protein
MALLSGWTAPLRLFLFVFLFLVLDHPPHQLFPMVFDVSLILFELVEDAFVSFPDFKQRMSGTTRTRLGIVHFLVLALDSFGNKKRPPHPPGMGRPPLLRPAERSKICLAAI